jgi:hypothetical protein
MKNLQGLHVNIHGQDIGRMVLSMTMFETIRGNVRGSMVVQDHINFMDTFMISTQQAPIKIEWLYEGHMFVNHFYADGIEKMELDKLGKKYTIHFLAYTTMNNQLTIINKSFSGRGDEIIHKIFREANPLPFGGIGVYNEGRFFVDSKAINTGKYVVPNIKAAEALTNVVNYCYDINKSPILLYQRLCDEGATRLTSLHDMNNTEFSVYNQTGTVTQKTTFILKAALAGASADSDGLDPDADIGTVSKFLMDEYNKDFVSKIASGFYGHKVQQISIDKTQTKNLPPAELTSIPSTVYKLQDNLYDNDAKSIFSTSCEPESYAAQSQKRRVFNMKMSAIDVIAIPGLSCGYSIETNSGESNINQSKTDTKYIISSIQHRFQMQDGKHQYSQDIQLIRDGSIDR